LLGSRITQPWQYYTIFVVIGAGLMCATVIPCSLIISNWFVARRGTAIAAAFVGTSIGGVFMSPTANWIILNYSWRSAFVFNGVILLVLVAPIIFFIIHARPSEIGLQPYRGAGTAEPDIAEHDKGVGIREAFGLRVFWQIALIMFIIGLVTNAVHTHAVRYLLDLGHSDTRAAAAWSLVMGVMVFGKLSFGPIADRWSAPFASAFEFAVYTASIVALIFAKSYGIAIVFSCLYGFACGAPLTINPLLTVENLGTRNFGTIYGILTIMASIGGGIGAVGAGGYFDRFDTYIPVFIVFAIFMALGAVCSVLIRGTAE